MRNNSILSVYILSTFNTGGISVFCTSLQSQLSKLGYTPILIVSPFKFFLSRYIFHRNSPHITYGLFNCLNLFHPNSIRIFHGLPSLRQQGFFKSTLYKLIILLSRFVSGVNLSISSYVHSGLLDAFLLNTFLVVNPIPIDFISSFENKSLDLQSRLSQWEHLNFKFCFLGRPTKFKLQKHWVVDILSEYASSSFSLLGPDSSVSVELSNYFGSDRVFTPGFLDRSAIFESLSSHLFLLTCSETEPFGLIFLEALLTSTFIVSPRSGGGLEIFSRVPSCYRQFFVFVNPGDSVTCKIRNHFDSLLPEFKPPTSADQRQLVEIFSPLAHARFISDFF